MTMNNKNMHDVTFQILQEILIPNYPEGALIKIFNEEQYALNFAEGEICLGTLAYYRNIEDAGDGRADPKDCVTDEETWGMGVAPDGKPIWYTKDDILTALVFCMFYYNPSNPNSFSNLKETIKKMGKYVCIIDFKDHDILTGCFALSSFKKSLSKKYDFNIRLIGNGQNVEYVDKPDYSGFQKRKAFASQQEYRYLFSLEKLRERFKDIDSISDQFIFKAKVMPSCFTFKITDL